MRKKHPTQAQKFAAWDLKIQKSTPPEEFYDLVSGLPEPEKLLGVDRVTLSRWRSGASRIPFAAAQLLRLLAGELPRHFGEWHGWRFLPDGFAYPPGWGEGVHRSDIVDLWTIRKKAFMVDALSMEVERLQRELKFYRQEAKTRARLGFAGALIDVLEER